MKSKLTMNYFLYCLLVFLITYQDSPLGKYMGAFGYSLIPSISLVLLLVFLIKDGFVIKPVLFEKKMTNLFLLLCAVSFVAIIIWIAVFDGRRLLGEDVFLKTIKGLMYFLSYIAFLYIMRRLTTNFTVAIFLKPVFYVFIITTIICIIEYFFSDAFSFLHFTGSEKYSRIRLLTKESSWTTMIIYVYSALSFYYSNYVIKKRIYTYLSLICLALLIFFTTSKSLMATIFMSIGVFLLLNSRNMSKKRMITSFCVLVLGIAGYLVMETKISTAIETSLQWSSIPTRLYTMFIGIVVGLRYPLGIGTAVYLSVFPEYLKKFYYIVSPFDNGYALREINGYISATTDEAVSVKSGLLQYNMYWGIVGTLLFIKYLLKYVYSPLSKSNIKGKVLLQTVLVVSFILLTFAVNFTFEFWLLVVFIMFCIKKENI